MKIKTSITRKIFVVFNYLLITLLCFMFVLPVLNVLAKSLNDGVDASRGGIWFWPRVFTWDT